MGWFPLFSSAEIIPQEHNGGLTQVNFSNLLTSGSYPFLNLVKTGDKIASNKTGIARPDRLNENGYPIDIDEGGGEVLSIIFFVPRPEDRESDYLALWDGPLGSQIDFGMVHTVTEGSKIVTSGTSGRCRFTSTAFQFDIRMNSNGITNLRVVHVDDETDLASGKIFGKQYLKKLTDGNFGVLRFLNWNSGNEAFLGQWKHNKPVDYVAYEAGECRPGIYAGDTSLSGSAYTVGDTPDGFVLEDKTMVIASIDTVSSGSAPYTLNVNGTGAKRIVGKYNQDFNPWKDTWTFLYDATLDVYFVNDIYGAGGIINWAPIEIMLALCVEVRAHPHFVTGVYAYEDNSDYWCRGLAAFLRDNKPAWMQPRIEGPNEDWNETNGVNQVWYSREIQKVRNGGTTNYTVTSLTYPSSHNGAGYADVILTGISTGTGALQLGSTLAPFGFDGVGSFAAFDGWDSHVVQFNVDGNANKIIIKTTSPFVTGSISAAAGTLNPVQFANHEFYGRGFSQMAGAFADEFGDDPKTTANYKTLIGVQTAYGTAPGNHDPRFDCHQWVIQGGVAPKMLARQITLANYYNPLASNTLQEAEDAYDVCVPLRNDLASKAPILATFIDSCSEDQTRYRDDVFPGWKTYAISKGVYEISCYEGGFSPDFVGVTNPADGTYFKGIRSVVTGVSNASSAIVSLGTTYVMAQATAVGPWPPWVFEDANPVKPGMLYFLAGIQGPDEGNCEYTPYAVDAVIRIGFTSNSPDITYTGNKVPVVGQGIAFSPVFNSYGYDPAMRIPHPLEMYIPYYVVYSSGNTIRVSATKGGTPITVTNGDAYLIGSTTGWIVLDKTDNEITLDWDTSGLDPWSSGGTQFACIACSDAYMNIYRTQAKLSPHLKDISLQGLQDILDLTDESFIGEHPSHYLLSGLNSNHLGGIGYDGGTWSISDDIYAADSPQFQAAIEFNHP